jgi:hypothetical protein
MAEIFIDGRMIDIILALVAVEAVALLALRAVFGRGPAPAAFVGNLLAGVFLLLALRNALDGGSWTWMAICLLAALVAHLADLALRFERVEARAAAPNINATISLRVPARRPKP